jgi:hypothetical protein
VFHEQSPVVVDAIQSLAAGKRLQVRLYSFWRLSLAVCWDNLIGILLRADRSKYLFLLKY